MQLTGVKKLILDTNEDLSAGDDASRLKTIEDVRRLMNELVKHGPPNQNRFEFFLWYQKEIINPILQAEEITLHPDFESLLVELMQSNIGTINDLWLYLSWLQPQLEPLGINPFEKPDFLSICVDVLGRCIEWNRNNVSQENHSIIKTLNKLLLPYIQAAKNSPIAEQQAAINDKPVSKVLHVLVLCEEALATLTSLPVKK